MGTSSSTAKRPATDTDAATPPAKPLARYCFEDVTASVFTKQVETKNGMTVTVCNTSVDRVYRDADGQVKYTHSLRTEDLQPASLALLKAYEFIQDAKQSRASS